MEEFPSEAELTVASALLLLSCTSSFSSTKTPSIPKLEEEENRIEIASKKVSEKFETELKCLQTSSETITCVSSLTYDDYSVHSRRLNLIEAIPARRNEVNLKVAKKARSKVIYRTSTSTANYQVKPAANITWKSPPITKPKTLGLTTDVTTTTVTTEGSCLSSGGSSEITSARSRTSGRRPEIRDRKGRATVEKKRRGLASFHIRRRAEAIMRFLGDGRCASEVRIRQVLGDSPDTSKALRMLLRMEEVKRTGVGGRSDPFIYKIAAESESIASCKSQALIV